MSRKIAERSVNPSGLFVLARDQAFFKALFFTGDRGSDLGMLRTEEVLRFPQDDGLLFNHACMGKNPVRWRFQRIRNSDTLTLSCAQLKPLKHM